LIDADQRAEARAALTSLMAVYDSPRAFFEKARLDIREGDSTAYCQDLAQAKRMDVEAIDGLYDQHCVRVDSGGLTAFGFDESLFRGITMVKRFTYRADGSSRTYLYDQPDTPRVGMLIERDTLTYIVLDTMPEFPGGDTAKFAFFRRNFRYPDAEFEQAIQGTVMVDLTVGPEGTIRGIRITERVSPGIDREALRVLALMPAWVPGRLHGTPVRAKIHLPIRFQLR